MDKKTYLSITTVIFGVVAFVHLYRIVTGMDVVISQWTAPIWVSWLGFVVGGYLAYSGYKFKK